MRRARREKNHSYRICVYLDFSGRSLRGADDPRVAGSHRPSHQGSDASNNLCRGAQVQRGQGGSRKRAADLWHGRGGDGRVIAGLTTALVEGGDPDRLPTVRTSLETSEKGLKEICDTAVKTITPNTKGVLEEVAKGAVEPLFKAISDGVGALWARHVEQDKLELETKKSQLEAAKWPKFADVVPQ
jgi:hypothetical protein